MENRPVDTLINFRTAARERRWIDTLGLAENLWDIDQYITADVCIIAHRAAKNLNDSIAQSLWLDRGLARFPAEWRLMRLMGDALKAAGETKAAADQYRRAVEVAPENATLQALYGEILLKQRDYKGAIDHLGRAMALGGANTHPAWLEWHGTAYLRLGNLVEAKASLEAANRMRPAQTLQWMLDDIARRLDNPTNSQEATEGFYDNVFSARKEYEVGWKESSYRKVWEAIVKKLRSAQLDSILDLGCGPGQFAECVHELAPDARYCGIDFSQVAIDQARAKLPEFEFHRMQLPLDDYGKFQPFDAVVCTEVLEHVERDVDILKPIPAGTFIVFSIPNFDSFGHVRVFDSASDVTSRYGHLVENMTVEAFPQGRGNVLWLACGNRAGASA